MSAELGVVGVGWLLTFYLITMKRLWPIARRKDTDIGELHVAVARLTIAAITGFMVSAQFVSLEGLELPYYVTMIGAGTLKLSSQKRDWNRPAAIQDQTAPWDFAPSTPLAPQSFTPIERRFV